MKDYEHHEECEAPDGAPYSCDMIEAQAEAYYAEPSNMAALENGDEMTPRW